MGFGLVCAGYSTVLFMRLVPVEVIGFFFVLKGLKRLCGFNNFFELAKKVTYLILAFSLIDCVYWGLSYFNIYTIQGADGVLTYIHRLVYLPFYFLLFAALRSISNDVGYTKGMSRATLAMSCAIVYYLSFALSRLSLSGFEQYFVVAEYILYIVLVLVTISAVYTCYRAITTDEAEEKEEEELRKFEARFGRNKNVKKAEKPSDKK